MSIESDCPSCMTGDHAHHDPAWGLRPGLIGGTYCGCTGDCAERARAGVEEWKVLLGKPETGQ